MPPFFELREVPQGARGEGEIADVQVLEGHAERTQAIQDVRLRRDRSLVVVLDHLEQILGGLAEARGLDQSIAACAHLGHLVVADGAVHHVVAVDLLHKLAMRLPHIGGAQRRTSPGTRRGRGLRLGFPGSCFLPFWLAERPYGPEGLPMLSRLPPTR